jgi:hypothetical protein
LVPGDSTVGDWNRHKPAKTYEHQFVAAKLSVTDVANTDALRSFLPETRTPTGWTA